MALEVLQRATWTDLIQVATVKSRLDIAVSDSTKDAYLQELVTDASGAVEAFCNRVFARQGYKETVLLDGSEYLVLSHLPIESFVDPVVDGFTLSGGVVNEEEDGILFREDRWIPVDSTLNFSIFPVPSTSAKVWAETIYVAGYLLPGQDSDWVADTAVAAGGFAKSSDSSVQLRFECTVAGTTDASEPTWPTTVGDTVVDNTATWTARASYLLPAQVVRATWETIHSYWNTDFRDVEILQRRISEQDFMEYARIRGDRSLPPLAMGLLKNHRRT